MVQLNCFKTLSLSAVDLVQDSHMVRYGLSPNPYQVAYHPIGDFHIDSDDPPADEVKADISLLPLPNPVALKFSSDLGSCLPFYLSLFMISSRLSRALFRDKLLDANLLFNFVLKVSILAI